MNLLKKLFGSAAPPENPELIRAMERAAKERTEESRTKVNRELMRSNLYLAIPAPIDGAKNCRWTKLKEGLDLKYLSTRNASGEVVVPVFTDEATLKNWKPNAFWIAMPARELFALVLQSEAAQSVINPGGATGGILTRGDLESIVTGLNPRQGGELEIPSNTRIKVGQPAKTLPADVIRRITDVLGLYPSVASAYLLMIAMNESAPRRALGLRMTQGVDKAVFQSLCTALDECVSPALEKNEPFDLMPLTGPLLETVERTIPAIYTR